MSGGVFTKMGNIKEFGATVDSKQGGDVKLDFEPDSMVAAPAVDDVTRTDQDLGAFVHAKVHERSEREPVRYRHALGDEPVHGGRFEPSPASEVKVRGVHEAEVGGSRCHSQEPYAYKGSKVGRSLSRVAWSLRDGRGLETPGGG
jgi:hypothetical protein